MTDRARIPRAWLALAVTAFLISVGYALLLVLARSGMVTLFGDNERGFQGVLTLHVNFSLLVWFLSMGGFFWSKNRPWGEDRANVLALATALAGVLLMAVAPLAGPVMPVMSDYLPVLDQGLFLAGMGLFVLAVSIVALPSLGGLRDALTGSADTAGLLCGAAALVLMLAGLQLLIGVATALPDSVPGYYQRLFWAPGHLLQTVNLLLLLQAWWLLKGGLRAAWTGRLFRVQVLLILLPVLASPLFPLLPAPWDSRVYTWQMGWSGLLAIPLLLGLLAGHGRSGSDSALQVFLRWPLWLLLLGFILGGLIEENNAWVPAHYHGVIGAITLSYMGVCYRYLKIPCDSHMTRRLLNWQAHLYAGGILLLMAGLIVSDIPRKGLVTESDLLPLGRLLMATGGGGALVASVLFVALVVPLRSGQTRAGLAEVTEGQGDA